MSACPFPTVRGVTTRMGGSYRFPVPCGRCAECLARVRRGKAGQAAMEGVSTVQKLGLGHVWMATLTHDDGDRVRWTDPRPVDLGSETLPGLTEYWVRRFAAKLYGGSLQVFDSLPPDVQAVFFARAQRAMGGYRWKFSPRDFDKLEAGDYESVRTLQYRQMKSYFNRLRRHGLRFRYFVAAEYGSRGTRRPHYHVLFYGLDRDQFMHALSLWDYGFVGPDFRTRTGLAGLDAQVQQNADPRAAAMYAGKYLSKGTQVPLTAGEAVRERERTRSSHHPGLGFDFAMEQLLPAVIRQWQAPLNVRGAQLFRGGDLPVVDSSTGEVLASSGVELFRAMTADAAVRDVFLGEHFPISRYLQDKVLAASPVPDELVQLVRHLNAARLHDEEQERRTDPEKALEYAAELERRKVIHDEKQAKREARERRKLERAAQRFGSDPVARRAASPVPV